MTECTDKNDRFIESEDDEYSEKNPENSEDDGIVRFKIPNDSPEAENAFDPNFTYDEYLVYLKKYVPDEYFQLFKLSQNENKIMEQLIHFISSLTPEDVFRYVTGVNRTKEDVELIETLMDRDEPFRTIIRHKQEVYRNLDFNNELFLAHLLEEVRHIEENQRKFDQKRKK